MQHPALRASEPVNVESLTKDELAARATQLERFAKAYRFNPAGGTLKFKDGQQFRVHGTLPEKMAFQVQQIGGVGQKPLRELSADTIRACVA